MNPSDYTWLTDHGVEVRRDDAGRWIAVHEGEIIGTGDTADDAVEKALVQSPNAEFLLDAMNEDAKTPADKLPIDPGSL